MTKKKMDDYWQQGQIWTFSENGEIVTERSVQEEKETEQEKEHVPTKEIRGFKENVVFENQEKSNRGIPKQKSLLMRAVRLLAKREYSCHSLRQALSRGMGPEESKEELDAVLLRLQDLGYLSDERFAQSRTRTRLSQYGNRRILQELRRHGVAENLVQETLHTLAQDEEQRCRVLWLKKFGQQPTTPKERDKQIRYFLYRGFSYSVIQNVITRSYFDEDEYI